MFIQEILEFGKGRIGYFARGNQLYTLALVNNMILYEESYCQKAEFEVLFMKNQFNVQRFIRLIKGPTSLYPAMEFFSELEKFGKSKILKFLNYPICIKESHNRRFTCLQNGYRGVIISKEGLNGNGSYKSVSPEHDRVSNSTELSVEI